MSQNDSNDESRDPIKDDESGMDPSQSTTKEAASSKKKKSRKSSKDKDKKKSSEDGKSKKKKKKKSRKSMSNGTGDSSVVTLAPLSDRSHRNSIDEPPQIPSTANPDDDAQDLLQEALKRADDIVPATKQSQDSILDTKGDHHTVQLPGAVESPQQAPKENANKSENQKRSNRNNDDKNTAVSSMELEMDTLNDYGNDVEDGIVHEDHEDQKIRALQARGAHRVHSDELAGGFHENNTDSNVMSEETQKLNEFIVQIATSEPQQEEVMFFDNNLELTALYASKEHRGDDDDTNSTLSSARYEVLEQLIDAPSVEDRHQHNNHHDYDHHNDTGMRQRRKSSNKNHSDDENDDESDNDREQTHEEKVRGSSTLGAVIAALKGDGTALKYNEKLNSSSVNSSRKSSVHQPEAKPKKPRGAILEMIEEGDTDHRGIFELWRESTSVKSFLSEFGDRLAHTNFWSEMKDPSSNTRTFWNFWIICVMVYNALLIPFRIGMRFHRYLETWYTCDYLGDASLWFDLFLMFHTHFQKDGLIVSDSKEIALRYVKGRFLLDLMTSMPLDWFQHEDQLLHVWYRVPRLIGFVRVIPAFETLERKTRYPAVVRLARLLLALIFLSHFEGCIWMVFGYVDGHGTNRWLPSKELIAQDTTTQYMSAILWSLAIMTGSGDGRNAETKSQIAFTIFTVFVGITFLAIIIGNVGSVLSSINANAAAFNQKMDTIKQFMQYRRLPPVLQRRIRGYYDYLWSRQKGLDDNSILDELPRPLRTEIYMYLNREILDKVPIFRNCEEGFLKSIVMLLKPQIYSPKDFIIREGDMGSEMYFISRGSVAVSKGDGEILATLGDGSFFGEIALLAQSTRTASVRALTFCDVFELSKADMERVLVAFPDSAKAMEEIAAERLHKDEVENRPGTAAVRSPMFGHSRLGTGLKRGGSSLNLMSKRNLSNLSMIRRPPGASGTRVIHHSNSNGSGSSKTSPNHPQSENASVQKSKSNDSLSPTGESNMNMHVIQEEEQEDVGVRGGEIIAKRNIRTALKAYKKHNLSAMDRWQLVRNAVFDRGMLEFLEESHRQQVIASLDCLSQVDQFIIDEMDPEQLHQLGMNVTRLLKYTNVELNFGY